MAKREERPASLESRVARAEEQLERSYISARIRRGLEQADRGQTVPARDALEALRRKYDIPLRV